MRRNQKGFSVVELLIVLVVFSVIVGAGWLIINNRPKSLAQILSGIKSNIPNSFNDVIVEQGEWTAQNVTNTPQKVDGYSYKLSPQNNSTIYFGVADTPAEKTVTRFLFFKKKLGSALVDNASRPRPLLDAKINDIFIKNKFSMSQEGENAIYKRNDDTCLYSISQLTCFTPKVIKSIAAESKPFVDLYLDKYPNQKAKDLVFGPLTIKSQNGSGVISSSHKAGYDIAEAIIVHGGRTRIVLYYQKPSGVWRYITDADDEFGFRCGPMIADPDARRAMYDQVCLSEKGQIRLDTNNRALQ